MRTVRRTLAALCMGGLCVAALCGLTPARTLAADPAPVAHARPQAQAPALDLSAPPVSHVMTPEQRQALTAQPSEDEPEEVTVQDNRYEAPVPRGQIRALAWALMHPLEAWRIFTPVTDQ